MVFEVGVPVKGGSGGGSVGSGRSDKGVDKLVKSIKDLNKTMFLNIDVIEIVSSLLGDLFKVMQPLFKILSLLFLVIFLPLLPLMMLLVKGLAMLVKLFTGETSVGKFIGKLVLGILLVALAVFLAPFATATAGIIAVGALLVAGFLLLYDSIQMFGQLIAQAAVFAFGKVMDFFGWIVSLGPVIMQKIVDGFSFFKDLGLKIWEIVKTPFMWIKNMFKGAINGVINFLNGLIPGNRFDIPALASGGIVTKPTLALIGEAGPEAVVPLGKGMGNTININNPTVRSDADIKALANEVGRALQRQMKGRISL